MLMSRKTSDCCPLCNFHVARQWGECAFVPGGTHMVLLCHLAASASASQSASPSNSGSASPSGVPEPLGSTYLRAATGHRIGPLLSGTPATACVKVHSRFALVCFFDQHIAIGCREQRHMPSHLRPLPAVALGNTLERPNMAFEVSGIGV